MSCRCGRRNNDTENAPLAQLVEHLTLNQGVQGSNPWRSTASTIFEDTGALGMVLFLRAMSHAINGKGTFWGACSP